jgi:hypothetical protein
MTNQPPPPVVVVQKKRGLGCFGCGCLVVLALLVLLGALAAAVVYFGYSQGKVLTTAAPSSLQSFDGGDAMYHDAIQKITVFGQALQQGQPANLELTADEINTIIARSPDLAANHVHLFVSLAGNEATLQLSVPTSVLPMGIGGLAEGRYLDAEMKFEPSFDVASKTLNLGLHGLRFGSETLPPDSLPTVEQEFDPALNSKLQSTPEAQPFLNHAKSVEIRDGKLEIDAQ